MTRSVPVTLSRLAELVSGRVDGRADVMIHSARPITSAGPGDITFIENAGNIDALKTCKATAAIVPEAVEVSGLPVLRSANPLAAFIVIYRLLHDIRDPEPVGIDARAVIHPEAVIGAGANIHPYAQVGARTVIGARCTLGPGAVIGPDCRLGDDVVIHANAVLYERCILGDRVIIHAGAIIGADGFGYRMVGGRHVKVPQLGQVEIGNDVEIGASTAIDRSTFDATRIGDGTKIDNLVQVAHNCQIGRHNIFVGQCGIAGSVTTGDYVVIAGQAGIKDHVTIGTAAIVGAQAGVMHDVRAKERVLGTPAVSWRDFTQNMWLASRLGDWRKDLEKIKAQLGLK
jgi:UDP-3-O-[3-hydroxymyristoyl] glucosamine N-acyltransferase